MDIDYNTANIGLKWYYQVYVIGYFLDFVPYKSQKKSKLPYKITYTYKTPQNRYIKNIGFKLEILYRFPKINIAQHKSDHVK